MRVELMEVPAQPIDDAGPLSDQVVAVSTSSRISRAGPSSRAIGSSGSRSAARATASASIGSDLP